VHPLRRVHARWYRGRSASKRLLRIAMEFARLAVVYVHLIACCVAIGLVLTHDIAVVKELLLGKSQSHADPQALVTLQATVSGALAVLWVTGTAIVALDTSVKGWEYFGNPKLQAKIGLVALLTANGVLLHRAVLPLLQKAGSLLKLTFDQRLLAVYTGAVSGVTWFYAAFIGVARPLAWKYSLLQLLSAYPALLLGGFCAMLALTSWAKARDDHRNRFYLETRLVAR
jgi:hypothetical protein